MGKPARFLHASVVPLTGDRLEDTLPQSVDPECHKPVGFWVSAGPQWLRFLQAQDLKFKRYWLRGKGLRQVSVFDVTLPDDAFSTLDRPADPTKVLVLLGEREARRFHARFRTETRRPFPEQRIEWNRVAVCYAGVLVAAEEYNRGPSWFQEWSVDSMCIWRPSVLRLGLRRIEFRCFGALRRFAGLR